MFAIKFVQFVQHMMSLGWDVLQLCFFWVGSILKYTIVTPANFRLFLVTKQKPWSPHWLGLYQVSIPEPFTESEGIKYIDWFKSQSRVLLVASWTNGGRCGSPEESWGTVIWRKVNRCEAAKITHIFHWGFSMWKCVKKWSKGAGFKENDK